MSKNQGWKLPKTSILLCPNQGCGHRKCNNCKPVPQKSNLAGGPVVIYRPATDCSPDCIQGAGHLRTKEHVKLTAKSFQCCYCHQVWPLSHWYMGDDSPSWDHRHEKRHSISENEFEGERIALESEIARGITTREEADDWLSRWNKLANGRYRHEEELFKKLAGDEGSN